MKHNIITTVPAEEQKNYPPAEEIFDTNQLVLTCDFDKIIEQLTGERGEYYIHEFISILEKQIKSNLSSVDSIKNRNFIKRITSPNIKDIGNILVEQNNIQAMFYIMLQLQTLSGAQCATILKSLTNKVNRKTKQDGDSFNAISNTFIQILEKNNSEACKNEIRDNALMKLLKDAKITKDELRSKLAQKQDSISDLDKIRSDAQKGATALQPTDIADWAKAEQKPEYKASEIKDLNIPTKTSQLNNDCGFLTEHQDISGKANISYVEEQLQHTKNDISREVSVLQQSLQIAQDDLQKEHQGYTKLKRALIATSICMGTISLGALVALLILIL